METQTRAATQVKAEPHFVSKKLTSEQIHNRNVRIKMRDLIKIKKILDEVDIDESEVAMKKRIDSLVAKLV